jgi:hypothetical protein
MILVPFLLDPVWVFHRQNSCVLELSLANGEQDCDASDRHIGALCDELGIGTECA